MDFNSELTTTVGMATFLGRVFSAFRAYGPYRLGHQFFLSKSESDTRSSVIKAKARPDTILVAQSCTLLGKA